MNIFKIFFPLVIVTLMFICEAHAQNKQSLVFLITGTVLEDSSSTNPKQPIKGAVIVLSGSDGSIITDTTDAFGKYKFDSSSVHAKTAYEIHVNARGYFGAKRKVKTVGLDSDKEFVIDYYLIKLHGHGPILPEINFESGKWELLAHYKDSLAGFIKTLEENPTLVIVLRAHTAGTGTEEYADTLSYKRVKSIVDYIISKGIEGERIQPEFCGNRIPRKLTRTMLVNGFSFPKDTILTKEYIEQFKDDKAKVDAAQQLNNYIEFKVLRCDYIPKNDNSNKYYPPILFIGSDSTDDKQK